jgi:hypothetical protein
MGNDEKPFTIVERIEDKQKDMRMYYKNVSETTYYRYESFNGYPINTPLETDFKWTAGASDQSDGTNVKGVYFDDVGYFYDQDNTKQLHKILTFSTVSNASGWSSISFVTEYPYGTVTGYVMRIIIGDGTAEAMIFEINENTVNVKEGLNSRKIQVGGSDVDPAGIHNWELKFNNTTKKIQVYVDGTQATIETGFDDYYNVLAGQLSTMEFITSLAADLMDLKIDNIKIDWITSINDFRGWFVRLPMHKARAIVGLDDLDLYTLRVDAVKYPIVTTFRKSDVVKRTDTGQKYDIMLASRIQDKLDIIRFIVKEIK